MPLIEILKLIGLDKLIAHIERYNAFLLNQYFQYVIPSDFITAHCFSQYSLRDLARNFTL